MVSFSKELMDMAFRISTERLPKENLGGSKQENKQAMVDRVS